MKRPADGWNRDDPVKDNTTPSRDGVGHDQPDPWRYQDDVYTPKHQSPGRMTDQKDV
jgi:hypothetical protein